MRLGLRGRILLITVITPLSLGLAALVTVHRNVQQHVDSSSIHESLQHSVLVFEAMLAARGRALAGGAAVIVRDPRFFSLLTLGVDQRDPLFAATVKGMAHDFNGITQTELFEVLDRRGRVLASVGASSTKAEARDSLVRLALRGRAEVAILAQDGAHYQVSVSPVRADGRIVGVLLLGSEIGARLARDLHVQMDCQVTFLSGDRITGTTLEKRLDQAALLTRIKRRREPLTRFHGMEVEKLKGESAVYLTLIRHLPGSAPTLNQLYAMQLSFDPETLFQRQMQRDLGLLAMVAVAGALVTGLTLSEKITRPISQLVRGAQEMQKGNYAQPVNIKSSDEIGFLARRFVEMRQREQVYVSSLEEAAKLKSEFISIASHELRTPISVISGYRDLLADGTLGKVKPEQMKALDVIKGSLEKLTRIAEQATQVAQVKGERLEVQVVEQQIGPVLERGIGVAMAAAPGRKVQVNVLVDVVKPFPVDGGLLSDALTNLVSNGIRFTADGGSVDVRAAEERGYLVIRVLDNGPGIPENRLDHLFDHGYSVLDHKGHHSSDELEYNSRGLGMGLAITRGIVEAHGGTVSAANRPQGGSEFLIRIPRVSEAKSQHAA